MFFIIGSTFYVLIATIALALMVSEYVLKYREKVFHQNLGSFDSREAWIQALQGKAIKDLRRMPYLNGNGRFPRIFIYFKGSKTSPQYTWQTAALIEGLAPYLSREELTKMLQHKSDLAQLIGKEVDGAILVHALQKHTDMNTEQYSRQINQAIEESKGENSIMYRQFAPFLRLADTIGLVCPYLASYGSVNKEYKDLCLTQIQEFQNYAFSEQYPYLPFHGYDLQSKAPLGKLGWGRGTGWYAMGLIDTYEIVGEEEKDLLRDWVLQLAEELVNYQKGNGGWSSTVSVSDSPTETSASAMLFYFLKKAVTLNLISKKGYESSIEKAEEYLRSQTNPLGMIMNTEAECLGLGNYSMNYTYMPFTVGMVLKGLSLNSHAS